MSKERDYLLSKPRYREMLYFIKQYPYFLAERNAILSGKGQSYGYPRGSEVGDPTAMTAIKLEKVQEKIRIIEKALARVPAEYQKGIIENVVYGGKIKPYPDYADTSTWKRWRRRFIFWVSELKE